MHNGAWNCLRGSCKKKKGSFKELCEYFGETKNDLNNLPKFQANTQKKTYVKPDPDKFKPVTEEIITHLGKRKIGEQTIKDWKIMSDEHGNIVFPFYRDNILTFVKYRQPRMWPQIQEEYETKCLGLSDEEVSKIKKPLKEWRDPNTESILFGMDMVSYNKPLVICEGEIDALSLYEAGVTNVVSVPSGCEDLNWITGAYDWLDNFQQIILFGDNDEPGMNMMSK